MLKKLSPNFQLSKYRDSAMPESGQVAASDCLISQSRCLSLLSAHAILDSVSLYFILTSSSVI